MKPFTVQMHEGQAAFNRFREAMKIIVSIPKSVVTEERQSVPPIKQKKKTTRRKN